MKYDDQPDQDRLGPAPKPIERLLPRRGLFALGAGGVLGVPALRAFAGDAEGDQCLPQPQQTAGPFWVDEMLERYDIRADTNSGVVEPGVPLRLSINVSEISGGSCEPASGIVVDLWHCNAPGVYSDIDSKGTFGQNYLRGFQIADDHGNVRFLSIYPGWYPGRAIHVHVRIRRFVDGVATFNFVTQLYFDESITQSIHAYVRPYATRGQPDTTNTTDFFYDSRLLCRSSYDGSRVVASFNAVVNSQPGVVSATQTPTDPHSAEHAFDVGGGTPRFLA